MSGHVRFPRAVKVLRQKYPRGTLVQVRFVTDAGDIVEFEGLLGAGDGPFHKILALAQEEEKPRQELSSQASRAP